MKWITAGISIVLLLLLGCVEDNPFKAETEVHGEGGNEHPHIEVAGTESGGPGNFQFSDLDPGRNGIQDAVILSFDKDIDPSSITASAFEMIKTAGGTGPVQFESISYYPEDRTAVLAGTFSNNTAYLLTVTAGSVLDMLGNELDPNHNALYDGAPWDDRLITFYAGSAAMRDITSPSITSNFPNTGNVGNLTPQPRVSFENGPMVVSQLNLNNFNLVRTSDSASVALQLVSATGSQIVTTPVNDLSYGVRYTVRLSAQITDTAGNYLDTNGDGYVWPNEPDLVWDFKIADDSTTHTEPPAVEQATLMPGNTWVRIEFDKSLTGDDVVMDAGTFIATNIQIIDSNGSIPITFETGADPSAVNCLLHRSTEGNATVYVSCKVADEYGNLLDGNRNGLGGTPGEDDWSKVL